MTTAETYPANSYGEWDNYDSTVDDTRPSLKTRILQGLAGGAAVLTFGGIIYAGFLKGDSPEPIPGRTAAQGGQAGQDREGRCTAVDVLKGSVPIAVERVERDGITRTRLATEDFARAVGVSVGKMYNGRKVELNCNPGVEYQEYILGERMQNVGGVPEIDRSITNTCVFMGTQNFEQPGSTQTAVFALCAAR